LVQISQNKRKIIIQVEDSGIGIEENSMLLIENPDPSNTNTHVGMANVMERIKLYYGSKASMGITRREPNGTIVKLILPIRKQDMMWS